MSLPLSLNRARLNQNIELIVVFMFAASISLWKPGIYVSSGCILLYALIRVLSDTPYRQQILSGWIPKAALGLYVLGVLAAMSQPALTEDLAVYARKGMFLLITAPLLLIFKDAKNRLAALLGLCLGLWVASIMNLLMIDQMLSDLRLTATWDVGMWGLSSGLMVSFFAPFALEKQASKQRLLFAISLVIALVILLLTAARGPWIATLGSVLLYLLLVQRKAFIYALIVVAVCYWPAKQIAPSAIQAFESRATSIVDVNNESNKIRLNLWSLSTAHLEDKFDNKPLAFWFGSGMESHVTALRAYFTTSSKLSSEQKTYLSERDYPGNDLHNMYLDTTAKMGIIWTVLSVFFLLALGVHCARLSTPSNRLPLAGLLVLTNFMIVGFFYDIMLHFGTFFMIFLLVLAAQTQYSLNRTAKICSAR